MDSTQQDSVAVAGPIGTTRVLAPDDVDWVSVGPAHFGAYTSSPYPDGRRVIWSNGLGRIVKLDHDTWDVLPTLWVPGAQRYSPEEAETSIAEWDRRNSGLGAIFQGLLEARKPRNLSSVYTLLDHEGVYYIAGESSTFRPLFQVYPFTKMALECLSDVMRREFSCSAYTSRPFARAPSRRT